MVLRELLKIYISWILSILFQNLLKKASNLSLSFQFANFTTLLSFQTIKKFLFQPQSSLSYQSLIIKNTKLNIETESISSVILFSICICETSLFGCFFILVWVKDSTFHLTIDFKGSRKCLRRNSMHQEANSDKKQSSFSSPYSRRNLQSVTALPYSWGIKRER